MIIEVNKYYLINHFVYKGECCLEEKCNNEFHPVCDVFGRTHLNECHWRKEACFAKHRNNILLDIAYNGECCVISADECPNNQLDIYKPVCDGIHTHQNICQFRLIFVLKILL